MTKRTRRQVSHRYFQAAIPPFYHSTDENKRSNMLFLAGILLSSAPSLAYDNGAPNSRLPAMGWSSWVALSPVGQHPIFDYCDTASIEAAADAFISLGFYEHGYRHFHLDDCWANVDRNATGFLQGELDHFTGRGMPDVVDYVHSKNLTFGLYTCAGTHTCVGGRPGSKDHWDQDAAVFAEWGVDWVKMDNCNTNGMGKPEDYCTVKISEFQIVSPDNILTYISLSL